jgi:hypothetical protein
MIRWPSTSGLSARDRVAMRREVILAYVRSHPLTTSREISDALIEESGGRPALLTGSLYIPPWIVYADLRKLEDAGVVEGRRESAVKAIGWMVADG